MCDPVSLGITAAVVGAAGSITTGIMGAKSASFNARELDRQAEIRREKAEYDVRQATTKFERLQGQTIASAATTGLSLQSFSDVLADSVMEHALEVKAIRWGGGNEARNLEGQAAGQRYNGQAAMIGGIFGAAGKLTGGLEKAYSYAGGPGRGDVGIGSWAATVNPTFRG